MNIVNQAHDRYEPGVPFTVPIWEDSLFLLLEDAAKNYPNRIAIDYFGAEITYKEVLEQTKCAASLLVSAGVKAGDTVAIILPNCPQAFVAFYACMRIGAVAAEHNPLAPAGELQGQFARHKAKVAVVWEKSVEACPLDGDTGLETVFAVDISAKFPRSQRMLLNLPVRMAREKREQLRSDVPSGMRSWDKEVQSASPISPTFPRPKGDDRAVILHTGGTNGVPKSVPLTHKNIGTNVNQCMFWVFELHEGAETCFSLLPYFHAFGLTFFLCAVVRKAATQIVLPKFDPEMALDAHRRRNVTFFVGVPPMFEKIAKEALRTDTDITSIRYSVAGAMALSDSIAQLWERTTGQIIIEGYGLSETSPVLCGSAFSKNRRLGTLGMPFPSTKLRLADLENPDIDVKDGEPGEILVKGPQVFSGYLDAPEETARVFTKDGWFRTGDIGINHNGYIDLADRKKELILSGGFNVYPSQVEAAIRTMPGVADVAVVGTPGSDNHEEVTAALILEEGSPAITLDDVRAWAEEALAHYALPRKIAFLTELPRNPIGKVMRRKVKEQLSHSATKAIETIIRSKDFDQE
jgi:Acyl-CoA synthetases (AMP-forming)/AMP-acid ligases II